MSREFDDEELLPLARAARQLPVVRGNKPPHPATLLRWATVGIRSTSGQIVKLETTFVGGTRMTTRAALQQLFARRSDLDYKSLPESTERQQRQLESQAAESIRRMKSAGLV